MAARHHIEDTCTFHPSRGPRTAPLWVAALVLLGGCHSSEGSGGSDQIVARVEIDASERFQTITGWEATAQAGQTAVARFATIRDTLARRAVHDLGITRLRLEVRSAAERGPGVLPQVSGRCRRYLVSNDNADPYVTNTAAFNFAELDNAIEHVVKPIQREVQRAGGKLFLNLNYVSFMEQCPAGAAYPHSDPEEYAEFVLTTYRHLRDQHGLVPDAWEVILEPENTVYWRGKEIGLAIVAAARRLERDGFRPRFIAPSTTKAANAPRYFAQMEKVAGVVPYLEEVAYHRYRGTAGADIAQIGRLSEARKVKTSMLEHIGSGYEDLHQDLKVGNVSAWQQFALAYPTKADDGAQYYLITDGDQPALRLAKSARYLRQYFRYIRPGAVRTQARTSNRRVDPVAFVGPGGEQVVVIKTRAAAQVTVSGLAAGVYETRYTTATADHVAGPAIRAQHGSVTVSIPAAGVLTLFSKRT